MRRHDPSASAGDSIILSRSAPFAFVLLAGCSTVGDLGRPAHVSAFVSPPQEKAFNETDEEREMQDRIWRFLKAPHAKGWFVADLKPEGAEYGRYYRQLKTTDYRSSRTRFNAVSDDVDADLGTIPSTFAAICDVREIDRRRAVAQDGIGGLEPDLAAGVTNRHTANEERIAQFTAALNFRYESYSYALDHLLVETPHEEAVSVNARLNDLAVFVDRATDDRFCDSAVTGGTPIVLEPQDQVPTFPHTRSDNAAS